MPRLRRPALQPKPLEWVGASKEALTRFPGKAVFVLHAFQKKSNKGAATPLREIELIRRRLAVAEQTYKLLYERD